MTWIADLYFFVCAAFAVLGAIGVVIAKGAIRSAMGLLLLILSVAGLFLSLRAQFLAAIQLIVYAGAIVILFLFVIMLLGPSADLPEDRRGRVMRGFGAVVFGLFMFAILPSLFRSAQSHGRAIAEPSFGSIDAFGWSLFNDALVPFELSSALLMVAVLGAVAVARGRQGEAARAMMPNSQPGLSVPAPEGPAAPAATVSPSHGGA